MTVRRTVTGLLAGLLGWAGAALVVPAAHADGTTDEASPGTATGVHQLPFACGEEWTGSTRATHRPDPAAVDFNAPQDLGRLVVASAPGIVTRVDNSGDSGYGRWVRVEHADGLATVYAHLRVTWVAPGQYVDQGAALGRVGDTGAVTGAHLHYEQRRDGAVQRAFFGGEQLAYGRPTVSANCGDSPLTGDWDGDRADEVAVFRRGAESTSFELYAAGAPPVSVRLGRPTDLPVAGDWDGDGRTDVGVRRQGARVFLLRTADGAVRRTKVGTRKELPLAGDWDGDGVTDLGLWRPATSRFRLLRPDGTRQVVRLGGPGVQPVTGDWDGDGATDVGVFAAGTFTLRTGPAEQPTLTTLPMGGAGDLAVTGDWNADGTTDLGTWTPSTATYTLRVAPGPGSARRPASGEPELRTLVFGRPR